MTRKLFGLIMRLMYRNLSKGDYGCEHCRESAQEILDKLEKREQVMILLTPDKKLVHGEQDRKATTSYVFMSYHLGTGVVPERYKLRQ